MKFVNLFLSRYSSAPESQQGSFKSCLQQWYQKICTHVQKNYIRNKTAQLLCMLFIQEYPQKVKHYFKSFFQLFCKNIIFMILSSVFFFELLYFIVEYFFQWTVVITWCWATWDWCISSSVSFNWWGGCCSTNTTHRYGRILYY